MSQVSYGTITITDTNDIESIIIEYAKNQSTSTAPESGWSTTRPSWEQGYYIWQRARIHKSGTPTSQDTFGTAVCLTGSTGSTGAAGRSLTATETKYAQVAANSTETQVKALAESRWTANVPTYSENLPEYWVRVVNTYSNPAETEKIYYKDNGLTSAVATAASANSTALSAQTDAANALLIANSAKDTISDLNQYFWRKKTASTNVPAGSYVTNIPGTTYEANPANGGFNSLVQAEGIYLRNGITTLSSWTGSALNFYNPGSAYPGMQLTGTELSFYNPSTHSASAILSETGLDISDGSIDLDSGTTDRVHFSTKNLTSAVSINGESKFDWRLYLGDKFGVTKAGYMSASSGKIGGTTINATSFYSLVDGTGYSFSNGGQFEIDGSGGSYIRMEQDNSDNNYLSVQLSQLYMVLGEEYGQEKVREIIEIVNTQDNFFDFWNGSYIWQYTIIDSTTQTPLVYDVFEYTDKLGNNEYFYDENQYLFNLTTDTAVDENTTYYQKIGDDFIVVDEPTGNPSSQNFYEKAEESWVQLSHKKYIQTLDIEVQDNKTYYQLVEYIAVDNPSGNPQAQEYYEIINGEYIITSDTEVQNNKTYYQYYINYIAVDNPSGDPASQGFYEELPYIEYDGLSRALTFTNDSLGNQQKLIISSGHEANELEKTSIEVDPNFINLILEATDESILALNLNYDNTDKISSLDINYNDEPIFSINEKNNFTLKTTTGFQFSQIGLFDYNGGLAIGII